MFNVLKLYCLSYLLSKLWGKHNFKMLALHQFDAEMPNLHYLNLLHNLYRRLCKDWSELLLESHALLLWVPE